MRGTIRGSHGYDSKHKGTSHNPIRIPIETMWEIIIKQFSVITNHIVSMRNSNELVEVAYPSYVKYSMCCSKCHNVDILTKEVTYVSHPLFYVFICPFVNESIYGLSTIKVFTFVNNYILLNILHIVDIFALKGAISLHVNHKSYL